MIKPHLHVVLLAALASWSCSSEDQRDRIVGALASDRIELSTETSEPIVEILVAEGERVEKGQLLLRQDSRRAAAQLAEAEAAVLQHQARLDELIRGPRSEQISAARANVAGAAKELEFRQSEFARIVEIEARNLASEEALDSARAALDAAQANEELRKAQLQELLSGTTVEELAQAEQAVRQAEARRDQIAVSLERHSITAPTDGLVDSRLFEVGERPNPGQPILILLSGKQPYARVYVPEAQRITLRPGAGVSISVDGMDAPIAGRIRWLSSDAMFTPYYALTERDRGHLTYAAKIDLDYSGERLPDGVPLTVKL